MREQSSQQTQKIISPTVQKMLFQTVQFHPMRSKDPELDFESIFSGIGKDSSTTNYHSNQSIEEPRSPNFKRNTSHTALFNQSHAQQLINRVKKLRQKEAEMEATFQMCIKKLEGEISCRQKNNAILREEVKVVRGELEETKNDIVWIREYVMGRVGDQNRAQNVQQSVRMEDKPLRKNRSGKLWKGGIVRMK